MSATTRRQRVRSVDETAFCRRCGYPLVSTRGGRRSCVVYGHPEPAREVLVRGESGRQWWEPLP